MRKHPARVLFVSLLIATVAMAGVLFVGKSTKQAGTTPGASSSEDKGLSVNGMPAEVRGGGAAKGNLHRTPRSKRTPSTIAALPHRHRLTEERASQAVMAEARDGGRTIGTSDDALLAEEVYEFVERFEQAYVRGILTPISLAIQYQQ